MTAIKICNTRTWMMPSAKLTLSIPVRPTKTASMIHTFGLYVGQVIVSKTKVLSVMSAIIRRDLSGSGLLIIVYKCSLLREWEERFESQSSASRSGIALGMSPSGVFPQVVDHHLEGATIPRPIAVAQSAKQLR